MTGQILKKLTRIQYNITWNVLVASVLCFVGPLLGFTGSGKVNLRLVYWWLLWSFSYVRVDNCWNKKGASKQLNQNDSSWKAMGSNLSTGIVLNLSVHWIARKLVRPIIVCASFTCDKLAQWLIELWVRPCLKPKSSSPMPMKVKCWDYRTPVWVSLKHQIVCWYQQDLPKYTNTNFWSLGK